jgi:hypothetical protein
LVVNLDEALRPPLLRVIQNTGHCILSPLEKRVPPGQYVNHHLQNALLVKSFTIIQSYAILMITDITAGYEGVG